MCCLRWTQVIPRDNCLGLSQRTFVPTGRNERLYAAEAVDSTFEIELNHMRPHGSKR